MTDRLLLAYGLIVLVALVVGIVAVRLVARRRAERNRSRRIDVTLKD